MTRVFDIFPVRLNLLFKISFFSFFLFLLIECYRPRPYYSSRKHKLDAIPGVHMGQSRFKADLVHHQWLPCHLSRLEGLWGRAHHHLLTLHCNWHCTRFLHRHPYNLKLKFHISFFPKMVLKSLSCCIVISAVPGWSLSWSSMSLRTCLTYTTDCLSWCEQFTHSEVCRFVLFFCFRRPECLASR